MDKILAWGEGPTFNTERLWKCEVCGKESTTTAKGAYEAGWDIPPYFFGYVKCEKCPITKTNWYSLVSDLKR